MKRGLANVIATFSLVLLVVVAVAVIWIVIQNIISNGRDDVLSKYNNLLNIGKGREGDLGEPIDVEGLQLSPEFNFVNNNIQGENYVLNEGDFVYPGRGVFLENKNPDSDPAYVYLISGSGGVGITGAQVANSEDELIDTLILDNEFTMWKVPLITGEYYFVSKDLNGELVKSNSIVVKDLSNKKVKTLSSTPLLLFDQSSPEWKDIVWNKNLVSGGTFSDESDQDKNLYSWLYVSRPNSYERDSISTIIHKGEEFSFNFSWVPPTQSSVDVRGDFSMVLKRSSNGEEVFRINAFCEKFENGGQKSVTVVSGLEDGVWRELSNSGLHSCPHHFANSLSRMSATISHLDEEGNTKILFQDNPDNSLSDGVDMFILRDFPYIVDGFEEDLILEFQIRGTQNIHTAMLLYGFNANHINPTYFEASSEEIYNYKKGISVPRTNARIYSWSEEQLTNDVKVEAHIYNEEGNYIGSYEKIIYGSGLIPGEEYSVSLDPITIFDEGGLDYKVEGTKYGLEFNLGLENDFTDDLRRDSINDLNDLEHDVPEGIVQKTFLFCVGCGERDEADCRDSDGGVNAFLKGVFSFDETSLILEDYCFQNTLFEHSCVYKKGFSSMKTTDGKKWYWRKTMECRNGCVEGKCNVGGICGNGIKENGEQCDGDLNGQTCISRGFSSGELKCISTNNFRASVPNVCNFDTSGCIN